MKFSFFHTVRRYYHEIFVKSNCILEKFSSNQIIAFRKILVKLLHELNRSALSNPFHAKNWKKKIPSKNFCYEFISRKIHDDILVKSLLYNRKNWQKILISRNFLKLQHIWQNVYRIAILYKLHYLGFCHLKIYCMLGFWEEKKKLS